VTDKSFGTAAIGLLRKHLEALVTVETTTIPLYLAAVYSFSERALGYSDDGGKTWPLYELQQGMLSVAVQEMYHLQLAANLCNSFHVSPSVPKLALHAGAPIVVPHLSENGSRIMTWIGNAPAALAAFIEIERPEPGAFPPPNDAVVYPSIGALYQATLDLLDRYLVAYEDAPPARDPHFAPDQRQIAYATFAETYRHNKIHARADLAKVASTITDQGEGNLVGRAPVGESGQVRPEFRPRSGSRFADYGAITHYRRFVDIQHTLAAHDWKQKIGGNLFYEDNSAKSDDLPGWAASQVVVQRSIDTLWSYLIDLIQHGFSTGNLSTASAESRGPRFGDVMLSFKYTLRQSWQWGHAPSFLYRPGVSADDARAAMDAVDPLCLFHWDARSDAIRARKQLNACQGLNQCAGLGWGGVATEKGNGACATADLHTCGGNNDCSAQGGCGYLSSGNSGEQWAPGENSCAGKGGCQMPIATAQVFDRSAHGDIEKSSWPAGTKQELSALVGKSVWDRARELFAKQIGSTHLPEPIAKQEAPLDLDGSKRRKAIEPTSK
jgi:hypothetical protein